MRFTAFIIVAMLTSVPAARADYLYAADDFDEKIYQILPTGLTTVLAQPTSTRIWMGTDGVGDLYVNTPGTVWKLGGGQSVVFTHPDPFNAPIAADQNGNVYLGNINNSALSKLTSSAALAWSVHLWVDGMVADANQNLYVNAYTPGGGPNFIWKVTPDAIVSGYYGNRSLSVEGQPAVDSAGDLYALAGNLSNGDNSLIEIAPNLTTTTLASGLRNPSGVAVDSTGTIYVTEQYQDQSGQWVNAIDKVANGVATPFATLPAANDFQGITGLDVSIVPVSVPEPALAWLVVTWTVLICRRKCR